AEKKFFKSPQVQILDNFLKGEEELLGFIHKHSLGAYNILKRYSLDKQFKNDPLIDGQEPILFKIGELGERYWTWIHQPYDGAVRMFKSNFLEQLTRTKWWVIPMFWLPLVITFLLEGNNLLINDFGPFIGFFFTFSLFMFGILFWTLMEYSLHRFIFHWHPNPNSKQQLTLHFLLHGLHHKTPLDKDRLVFPPAAALIIVGFFYSFYRLLLPYPIFCCFGTGKLTGYIIYDLIHYYMAFITKTPLDKDRLVFPPAAALIIVGFFYSFYRLLLPYPIFCCFGTGKLTGYIIYDLIHYYLHHGTPEANSKWHKRKIYHHNHHFKDSQSGFGISTTLWDHVFGTLGAVR
uniref:Fatty acid 2-hydroxylase n=1 Tax=Meloidogyne incognita TaxID=6306 RepID=A0A914M689_MELIC